MVYLVRSNSNFEVYVLLVKNPSHAKSWDII